MVTSFECPSCGAALEPPRAPVASLSCPYCGTTVVVPETLRPHPIETPHPVEALHPPEGFTINIRSPEDGVSGPQITVNVPPEELAQLRQVETFMQTARTRRARRGFLGCAGCGCLTPLLFFVVFAGFMVFIFGFSIKNSVLYKCAVQEAQGSADVVKLIGAPIKAGTFAWISSYNSSGTREAGDFTTDLSGPRGSGTLNVSGSHDRSNLSLDVTFETGTRIVKVHSGKATCE
ncbi:MAG TPA: cytochrome c oxidase assembly factor Coa1 family protein [Anaerolineae bacterium]|nr:cytochrome c oxidase assembly factor Coa1 family protein [Anaerolineae bacterium]